MQNNNFILRENEGGEVGEPFKALEIANNTLNLAFEGGGLWRWKLNYEFKYQDKKTSLTWNVWRNAREPYKFKGVDIVESSNTPFIVAHYTNLQGEGIIHVTLSKLELYANHVISCKGDPKFFTMEFKNDNMRQYRTCTGIATDIDIICTTK